MKFPQAVEAYKEYAKRQPQMNPKHLDALEPHPDASPGGGVATRGLGKFKPAAAKGCAGFSSKTKADRKKRADARLEYRRGAAPPCLIAGVISAYPSLEVDKHGRCTVQEKVTSPNGLKVVCNAKNTFDKAGKSAASSPVSGPLVSQRSTVPALVARTASRPTAPRSQTVRLRLKKKQII